VLLPPPLPALPGTICPKITGQRPVTISPSRVTDTRPSYAPTSLATVILLWVRSHIETYLDLGTPKNVSSVTIPTQKCTSILMITKCIPIHPTGILVWLSRTRLWGALINVYMVNIILVFVFTLNFPIIIRHLLFNNSESRTKIIEKVCEWSHQMLFICVHQVYTATDPVIN
jgi:hypothetical protein